MKLLTGNDLASGDVIWWSGDGWSRRVEDAADVVDGGAIGEAEERARRVTGPYVIDATPTPAGAPRPAHIKDRIRALGPTVRPDLTLKPGDLSAVQQVI